MIIKGATKEEIEGAKRNINTEHFAGNILFKMFEAKRPGRDGKPIFHVTLTVNDSKQPGARRGFTGRRMACACWHVHGYFIDSLPEGTEVHTSTGLGPKVVHPGDRWYDWNAGSIISPAYMSELCDCGK